MRKMPDSGNQPKSTALNLQSSTFDVQQIAVIGGGAAGYFAAITAAETSPNARVTIYEQGRRTLSKVKISGGGRCNVTHHCFDPKELAAHYPRGSRELRGAFHRWAPQDTIDWFAARGVSLKAEADGRMFPTTDDSQTVIDCFQEEARRLNIRLEKNLGLKALSPTEDGAFLMEMSDGRWIHADRVALTAGSLKASPLLRSLEQIGHHVELPVPSLFAFNLADARTHGLAGISVPLATVRTERKGSTQKGPLLITHRGLSGPAILRLSAWEARELQAENYHFNIFINWLGQRTGAEVAARFSELRCSAGRNLVRKSPLESLPGRLWERLVKTSGIPDDTTWAQLPKKQANALVEALTNGHYSVQGKTTNKDEFVSCGGVRLKEVDFRTMQSRRVPGLFFAGECLDIDGITGGFNFQAAWTTGRIAGLAMVQYNHDGSNIDSTRREMD
ncbi:MAG: NAD(P)/FAD-dependent oxidoreductase [Opitutales bacterium]